MKLRIAHSHCFVVLLASLTALVFVSSAAAQAAIDSSFGGTGSVETKVYPDGKWPQAANTVALQADGKVIVGVYLDAHYGKKNALPLMRLNADGSRDTSYGKNGVAWLKIRGVSYTGVQRMALLPDGELVVSGYYGKHNPAISGIYVAKIDVAGHVARRFGDHGALRIKTAAADRKLLAITPTGGGQMMLATSGHDRNFSTQLLLTRISSRGKLQRGYAKNGTKTITLVKRNLGEVTDLRIVGGEAVALVHLDGPPAQCKVIRALTSEAGGYVNIFGGAGAVGFSPFPDVDSLGCSAVSLTGDGGVLVGGSYKKLSVSPNSHGFLIKLRADGTADPAYGVAGVADVRFPVGGIAQVSDGELLTSGQSGVPSTPTVPTTGHGLAEIFGPTGLLDTTFGVAGIQRTGPKARPGKFVQGASGSVVIYTTFSGNDVTGSYVTKFAN